jgi:2-dehydropantoate 2-reductase
MIKIENVLIAGAGSVGLTVANTIAASKQADLRILAQGERLKRYSTNGLFVNGKKLDVLFANPDVKTDWIPDLIIIACKNHHLKTILSDISQFVGKDTLILSLLNGITSETFIRDKYGKEKTPLAMILGTDAGHTGTETTYVNAGTINFGDDTNDIETSFANTYVQCAKCSERVQRIAEFFERCKLDFTVPKNMIRQLWFKFMCNVGINQSSAILKLPYGAFQQKDSPARALMISAHKEAIAVSIPEGINLNDNDIDNWLQTLDTISPTGKTSMCQDVCAGRKTEVELFAKTIVELGKKHHIPTPVNMVFYQQLQTLENNYNLL